MKKVILLSLLIVTTITIFSQTHNIKFKVTGITDTTAILGYHAGTKTYVTDTVKINKKHEGIFSGKKILPQGIYFIMFPSKKNYFDFVIDADQNFSLITDTTEDFRKNLKFKGSEINILFNKLDKDLSAINIEFVNASKKLKNKDISDEEKTKLHNKIKELRGKRRKIILNYYNTTKNESFKDIIGLMLEPKVPEFKVPENITNKDSVLQQKKYYYYKKHYWDYVNFQDSIILRTPFFIPKFERYLSKIILQDPDSVLKESVALIEKARGNKTIFSYLINYTLVYHEKAKLMGMDKVFVEIAKKYYATGEATWADSAYNAKVIDKMKKTEPNLIGNYAPDIRNVETYNGEITSLSKLKNDYIIIVFWSPTCGHCKKSIPKLYNIYNELLTSGIDVEVFSVLESHDVTKWKKFIKEKGITKWINVYDKDQKTYFHYYYDIFSTPVIYVLDKHKKIIAKRISAEQAKDYIIQLESIESAKK